MALSGTLQDFSVVDILQLISQQQKSGVLSLKHDDDLLEILFDTGRVARADFDPPRREEQLARFLVRAGALSPGEARECLEIHRQTAQRLVDVVFERGKLDRTTVQDLLALYTEEAIFRALQWKEGHYEFHPSESANYTKTLVRTVSAEHLLMEGLRQVDEWPQVRSVIASNDVVFRVRGEAREGDQIKETFLKKVEDEDRPILDLIDGERTVDEIVHRARKGEFAACKALANLKRLKIIEPTGEGGAAAAEEPRLRRFFRAWGGRVALALPILLLAGALVRAVRAPRVRARSGRMSVNFLESALARVQEERLASALETGRELLGKYPETLDELVRRGLLRNRDLTFPFGAPYHYEVKDSGYLLMEPKRKR